MLWCEVGLMMGSVGDIDDTWLFGTNIGNTCILSFLFSMNFLHKMAALPLKQIVIRTT